MSRTFRKKNYEAENNTSWDRQGWKVAGFYTYKEFHTTRDGNAPYDGRCGYYYTYEVPTKEQFVKRYWSNHGESRSGNSVSPGREYRRYRMKQNRMITRNELFKYIADSDYDVMVEANPRSCWWDWD